jgi:hypothetical protein
MIEPNKKPAVAAGKTKIHLKAEPEPDLSSDSSLSPFVDG